MFVFFSYFVKDVTFVIWLWTVLLLRLFEAAEASSVVLGAKVATELWREIQQ